MRNTVAPLGNGDFVVYYTDEERDVVNRSAIESLRKQRYAAVQAGKHSLVNSLDKEIAFLVQLFPNV